MMMSLSITAIKADAVTNIKVDKVIAEGNSVTVPVRLSGNSGICGLVITISYDKSLVLTDIESGDALSSLTMTKPGKLTDNPVKLVWDGLEADDTNGVIAMLTFSVPQNAGIYDISISYKDGDIVDGNLLPVNVGAENGSITVLGEMTKEIPTISIGKVTSKPGGQIKVPISISDNTGICGAALSISYDSSLVLSDISNGTALSSLVMTKSGSLSSNPLKLVWDGIESDDSNGIIAVLTFTVPTDAGSYNISVGYDNGDIVDGNLNPIDVKIEHGQVRVALPKNIAVEIAGETITLIGEKDADNEVIVAFYNDDKTLISVQNYSDTDSVIKIDNIEDASYAKIMLWERLNTLRPIDGTQTVSLKQ